MKKLLLLIFMLLLLVACASPVDKLNGTWKCDAKATIEANKGQQMQETLASELAKNMLSSMLESAGMIIDTENKTITLSFGPMKQENPLNIISEDGDTVTIDIQGEKGTFVVIDSNTVHVKNIGNKDALSTMIFKKETE